MRAEGEQFIATPFDPAFDDGPAPANTLHLNNVHCERGGMFHQRACAPRGVLIFNGKTAQRWVSIPVGAHNARPFRDGVLFNDTASDVVRFVSRDGGAGLSGAALSRPKP